MSAANSISTATVDHLTRFAPFNQMEHEHLLWLAERLKLADFSPGETVVSPETGLVETCYIIKQGVIHGEQDVVRAQDDAAWLELHEGECFPLGALLSGRPVNSVYKAGVDTCCYELAGGDFRELLRKCPAFHDFCTRRIANLLEQSKQVIQAQYAKVSAEQQSMTSPLAAIIRREPITCAPDTPMRQVLETMNGLAIGSMVAVDEEKRPLGIFTLHDVLSRVTLPDLDLNTPFSAVMSPDPVTLPPHALAYEAAVVMAKHGFRHILVEENGRLTGLLSEKDLFSLQRVGLRQLNNVIRKAADLESLKHAAEDIRQLAHNMLAQGVAAEQLTQIISTLNDLLTSRIIELALEANPAAREVEFCWLALGSEGRFEQTLHTDQDNGLIFAVPEGENAEHLRAPMLAAARRINEWLDDCGFPLCKGEIMASNPNWCLSLAEWQHTFGDWIFRGDAPVLLNASIFFDFRALAGEARLGEALRAWLNDRIGENRQFLKLMVRNALGNRPPLGLVRDFVVDGEGEEGNTIDLKLHGTTPFVDAARIFALAAGLDETGTVRRLRGAGAVWKMNGQEVEAWVEGFLFIQQIRLQLHQSQLEKRMPLSNRLNPKHLTAVERQALKESFRQAKKLQGRLESFFQF